MKQQLLSPFSSSILSKPSVSAAKLTSDETSTSFNSIDPNPAGPVSEIIGNLRNLGFKSFIDGEDSKNLILRLSEYQFVGIIDCLRIESLDLVVTFLSVVDNTGHYNLQLTVYRFHVISAMLWLCSSLRVALAQLQGL